MSPRNKDESRVCDFCLCRACCCFFRQILIILSFLLALVVFPVVLLFLVPIYLLRFLVSLLAKCCRSDLGKMLTTRSSIFAVDGIYEQPLSGNVARFVFEGRCDLQQTIKLIDQEWLQATFSNGDLKYPELQQSVTQWIGFLFWRNDDDFNVINHVKLYENKRPGNFIGMSEVNEVWNELSMMPFEKDKSPWEILIFPLLLENEHQEVAQSAIIFRWHHALSDGFSILNLLTSVASINLNTVAKARVNSKSRGCCRSLCNGIGSFFMAPYLILATLFTSPDDNPWHFSEKKLTRYWHLAVGENIPIDTIHDIKTGFNVSFTSVVLAALAGAMKKMMMNDVGVIEGAKKIPKNITCGIPFPLPNHPEKLRNHWAICTVSLPVNEENPFKRLQMINKNVEEIRQTHLPDVSYMLMPFIGGLTANWIRSWATNHLTTLVCSIMPGPPEPLRNYMDKDVLDAMYINGCGPGRNGFSFSVFSFSGSITFAVTVDSAFSPDATIAQQLTVAISEELNFLKQSVRKSMPV